ncbi:hypothetical protein PG999_008841 [Apiospora kogelbergensis]|uniref:Ankyrin repeat-containing protein n=1 Tax=Apiospora kogelbergensis TaxID=1337665 RepID=A0AAW0QHL1_9PEZI
MVSSLEALPNEILDSILEFLISHTLGRLRDCDHLDCMSLARLSQCSHFLNRRLEPLLYGTHDARNAALRDGCVTGNLPAIRKATSYGANPGVLRRYISNKAVLHVDQATGYREFSSLQLALKARQLEAFKLLLELGAGITPRDYSGVKGLDSQLKTFAERLAEVQSVAFLKAFVEARAETPYWQDGRKEECSQAKAVLSRLPFPEVVRWATPALLETLVDNGASLNQAFPSSFHDDPRKKRPMTPLGAACLRGDLEVFHLLVARGAQVNVDDSLRNEYSNGHTHIPIFVAAHYMAETGDPSMLDACVAGGADVNLPCHIHDPSLSPEAHFSRVPPYHVCTTPLLVYIKAIQLWDTATHLTPTEGVDHFIHALGANVVSPVATPFKRAYTNFNQELHDRNFEGIPSPVELLLVNCGIESLAIPEFFSTIRLLVQHNGTGPDLARILVRLDGQTDWSGDKPVVDVEGLWQQFLALLKPQWELLDQTAKDSLLRRVIVDKAGLRSRVGHPSVWIKCQAIGRTSISALVRAGADINCVASKNDPYPSRNTPLHQLVSSFVHTDCLVEDHLHDHPRGVYCPYTRDILESFGGFLAHLVNEGADPLAVDTSEHREDERTAIDTLLSPMRKGRIKHKGGTVEQGLMHFVAKLQGTRPATSYKGDRKNYDYDRWDAFKCIQWYGPNDCKVSNANVGYQNARW